MVNAVRRLEEAVSAGYASSYAGTTVCGLAEDTNRGYLQELRKFTRRIRQQPGASARTSLDNQVLHLAQTTQSESSLKKLLSGLRLLEKLRWIPQTVSAGDWLVVQAMEKYQEKLGKISSKSLASMRGFASMCKLARSPADWVLCAMAALSMSFSLRAVEALSVSYDGGTVEYMGAKGRRGRHSEEAGPWAREWGEFLQMLRARHGFPPARSAWFPSRAALHKGFGELVGRPESDCKALRWHSWRQYGAAQLRLLGAPTQSLLRWGGWATPSMLKVYAYPPSSWSFVRGGPCRSPRSTNTGESRFLKGRVRRCNSGRRGCGPTLRWQTKRKGAPSDLLDCNHLGQPSRKGAAPVRSRHKGQGRREGCEHGVLQAVAAASALQGVKSGRAKMVRRALLDMFAAVRKMTGGFEGSRVLLKALNLVIQSGLGEDEEQLYDRFCPPPPLETHIQAKAGGDRGYGQGGSG